MSVTNESRIRSWFQFKSSSNNANNGLNTGNGFNGRSDDDNSAHKEQMECQSTGSQTQTQTSQHTANTSSTNTLLERVTSFRRSLGKAQNKKNKIRPTSNKGLTSGAIEQQSIAKSKNSSVRKASSPTSLATSGGSAASANCDDDEIYGFTSANFDSSANSTRRQIKSSLQASNAPNAVPISVPNTSIASIAPNINVYDSDPNKSGRVRNEERDESHAITTSANTTGPKSISQDSPEWLKADKEFSFYNQQNQQSFDSRDSIQSRLYYYKQQYFHDSDINLRHSSTQHLSWVGPINSETDDIDRIYENMRGLSSALASAQQRHHNHRNSTISSSNLYANSVNHLSDNNNTINQNNRKLTKDSGYESASAISNWAAINSNNANVLSNNYFHSRSDSNTSSVSTGGSLSPRTAANSAVKSAYHYCDHWSAAKSTSNLPLQVQVSGNRRSSLTASSHPYPDNIVNSGKSVLPAKSVPGNLDIDSDENIVKKRSQNRNNPTPSSVYSLLASKSGFDFAPVLKSHRKSCGPSFAENPILSKYNERILPKKMEANSSQLWKTRDKNAIKSYGPEDRYETDDSPPPTPPVRDSSLGNRKFNSELQESEAQNQRMADLTKGPTDCGHYYKNNNSHYYMKSYSESRVSHIGCSKSLINLRSKYDESSDLKQFSQTYPLLPETEFNDKSSQLHESWSCDQSVTSGVTSLVTTSDYFTASSSVITHSPSLSSLSTTATNTTTASYNNSRNSISSTSSSSQIAKSSKVVQPKRESASVLYYEKSGSPPNNSSASKAADVPPPPPPKALNLSDPIDKDSAVRTATSFAPKMVSTSRSIETSKSHRASDPEIKAIQKRAVYQFYLKHKQKEKQENNNNCNNYSNNNSCNTSASVVTPEDTVQVPSRKCHLVVTENIYENSTVRCVPSSSPPLPSPPLQTAADIEFVGDLPLPPPPIVQEFEPQNVTTLSHPLYHNCDQTFASNGQQLGRSPSPPKELSPQAPGSSPDLQQKSEIATQTCGPAIGSVTGISQQLYKSSLESIEPMYQNSIPVPTTQTTGELSGTNKSIESGEQLAPWAYSKLWPNDKSAKTTYYDNSYISAQTSPIVAANTFIGDTGVAVGPTNEDLLANKSELISSLSRKLDVLRSEEMALTQDIDSNENLGQQVRNKLKSLGLSSQESEKIDLHCDETEKVTRLLLSISARLQLIESQINCLSHQNDNEFKQNSMPLESTQQTLNDFQQIRDKQNAFSSNKLFDEMQSLVSKRHKLLAQLEEALQLRVSIEHRNQLIEEKIVKKYFINNNENLNEFLEFIKLKSKLIVDIREVRDKIQMGERHLCALRTS